MTRDTQQERRDWRKPELVRIGSIADIAGKPVPFDQDANNAKS